MKDTFHIDGIFQTNGKGKGVSREIQCLQGRKAQKKHTDTKG